MRARLWKLAAGMLLLLALLAFAACGSSRVTGAAAATATAGDIRIIMDHTSYATSNPLGVTVQNTSKTAYYAINGKSDCTVIQLQRYDGKAWVPALGCTSAEEPRALQLAASSAVPYTLGPSSAANKGSWQSGIYRIELVYSTNADGKTSAKMAYSSAFTIQ